jgi:hypothetical protein
MVGWVGRTHVEKNMHVFDHFVPAESMAASGRRRTEAIADSIATAIRRAFVRPLHMRDEPGPPPPRNAISVLQDQYGPFRPMSWTSSDAGILRAVAYALLSAGVKDTLSIPELDAWQVPRFCLPIRRLEPKFEDIWHGIPGVRYSTIPSDLQQHLASFTRRLYLSDGYCEWAVCK